MFGVPVGWKRWTEDTLPLLSHQETLSDLKVFRGYPLDRGSVESFAEPILDSMALFSKSFSGHRATGASKIPTYFLRAFDRQVGTLGIARLSFRVRGRWRSWLANQASQIDRAERSYGVPGHRYQLSTWRLGGEMKMPVVFCHAVRHDDILHGFVRKGRIPNIEIRAKKETATATLNRVQDHCI